MHFAIVGGGVSGMTAAFYLRRFGFKGKLILIESSDRLGGWIKTYKNSEGTLFEVGPRTLRVTGNAGRNMLQLLEILNLKDKIHSIPSDHASVQNRYIKVNQKLHKLPNSVINAFRTVPPFSKPLALCVLKDLSARKISSDDESIYSFALRRFGQEVAMYVVDPLCRGIFAGSAKELSVKTLFGHLYRAEQQYGSVCKGLLLDKVNAELMDETLNCDLTQRAMKENWSVYSLSGGLQTLIMALENELKKLDVEIIKNSKIMELKFKSCDRILMTDSDRRCYIADKVILCLPALNLKHILKDFDKSLFTLLNGISYCSVAVVNLEYDGNLIKEPGFGYLIPSLENNRVLGIIFDSVAFPQDKKTVLTVMMGGYWFQDSFGSDPKENDLLETALYEVNNTLNISLVPKYCKVHILRNCIPQYTVGHYERVHNVRKLIEGFNVPLILAGNSYDGIGINDAVYSTKQIVKGCV